MLWSLSVVLKTVSFHVRENAFSHFSSPRNLNTLQAFAGKPKRVESPQELAMGNRALLITHLDWISTFGVGVGDALIRSVSDIARGSSEARELRVSSCRWVGGSLIAL